MSFPPLCPTPSSPSCVFILLVAAHIGIFKIAARALLHKEPCFACQGHCCLGSNHTLLASGHIMKDGGSRPSPVGWRPKAALFQGSDVRRARMHWGCRALEPNTWGTHSPGRYLSKSPLSFVCFHTSGVYCLSAQIFLLGSGHISELHFPGLHFFSVFSQPSLLIWQAQAPISACN